MLRLQNNTPPVYTDESRDFQLFCRLYDCIINGITYDINTIPNMFDAHKINNQLLSLLSIRQGFLTKKNLNTDIVRAILSVFPYVLKYKGSKKGIELCVNTILKLEGIYEVPRIEIDEQNLMVTIYTESIISNRVALDELLKYVLPVGYIYNVERHLYRETGSELVTHGKVYTLINPTISNSQVIGSDRYSDYVYDIEFVLTTASGDTKTVWKHFIYNQDEIVINSTTKTVSYSMVLNKVFGMNDLRGSTVAISILGANCHIIDSSGNTLATIKDTETQEFDIPESETILDNVITIEAYNVKIGDSTVFGFRNRLERLYVGSFIATQVIGSKDYLQVVNTSDELVYANDVNGTRRSKIDASYLSNTDTLKYYNVTDRINKTTAELDKDITTVDEFNA